MKILVSVTMALAASQFAGTAIAREISDDPPRQVVRFADLDLTRQPGAVTLLSRLRAAARDVCEPMNSRWQESLQCTEVAVARAVADVNAPVLTDYYLAKTGRNAESFAELRRERLAARIEVEVR